MNRRNFLAGLGLLVAGCARAVPVAGQTPEVPVPVDFLRREFLNRRTSVPPEEVRSLRASGYVLDSESEVTAAVEVLVAAAQDSMGFEISIGEATPLPIASPEPGASEWFVTYPTWAGAAGFYQEHAEGIFAIGNRVFVVEVAGLDPELLTSVLSVQVDLIREKSGSLADVLPGEADVPEELDLYREQRPDGSFDPDGNRLDDDWPWWPNPLQ